MKIVLGQNKVEQEVPYVTVFIDSEEFRIYQHESTGELTITKITKGELFVIPRVANSIAIK